MNMQTEKYNRTWLKYLPVIKLLMKKSAKGQQSISLSKIDFIKAGAPVKGYHAFKLNFIGGSVDNNANSLPIAKDFVAAMMREASIKELLAVSDYDISMNSKFELTIKNTSAVTLLPEQAN